MQVNSSNSSLQNRCFSDAFSKKKSSVGDEEYRRKIREQAECVKADKFCGNNENALVE